ncbi:hotdog fold thioesterase [Janibacter terrae]|uniref:Hotdog fold thioesterase n=1 Tax=Janibacter terrae TaxID=103817 RepID=A0ABZ2FC12_9MICO|nr:aromatic compound degradation protein PaaI [Kytococcus sp.]HBO55134.1 aromatic compound degradation protein PaaI [Janibacter terrae]HCE60539.1 aromatic compound degradation protein PaaI [Janibacter terrae]
MTTDSLPQPGQLDAEDFVGIRGPLAERMGIEVLEASADRVVARMPVEGNTQPYGILHGGASVVLAETLGSIGSAIHAAGLGKICVGLDINATHHRAVASGWVTGTAVPVSLGRTATCYEITITDEEGRRTCTCRITCLLRDQPPGV